MSSYGLKGGYAMPIRALLPDEDMRGRFAITMGRKAASLANRELGDKRSSKSGKSAAASNLARKGN